MIRPLVIINFPYKRRKCYVPRRALVKDINDEPRKDILQYEGEFTYEDRKKQTPKQYRVINNSDGTKDYVCEWDVIQVRHMVKHLSREDFLKEV